MKKFLYTIIIISIFIIAILLFVNIYNSCQTEIISGPARITVQEMSDYVSDFNSQFEEFYGINSSKDTKKFLQQCIKNYLEHCIEPNKIPTINFITDKEKTTVEYDWGNVTYKNRKESKHYIGLKNIKKEILSDKSYKIEFKYRIIEPSVVLLIEEIDVTECNEKPRKFNKEDLKNKRVNVEDSNEFEIAE